MSYAPSGRTSGHIKKFLACEDDIHRRNLLLGLNALYSGARGSLSVQAELLEPGRYDEMLAMLEKQDRQIDNLIKAGRRERH
jgi:hypothetical protein